MNNIITGSKGFVAGNLKKYLICLNKNVTGVSRIPLHDDLGYDEITLDIMNKSISFIHLAGKAHDLKKTSEDKDYFEVNTELTKDLYDKFLISDCEVFIYMSSVKAAADVVDGVLTEDIFPNPITVYGKSKLAAETYILSKKIPDNKRIYILRPCMIHGANNRGNLNLLYSFVSKGIPYPFGKYINKRSFTSVENVCFIINELIDNGDIESGIYNIADDVSLSTVDLVKIMFEVLNKPIRILKLPFFFINFMAKIGDLFPLPINSERLQKLTENYEVSNLKIKNAINKKLPLSSIEGVKKTIASF